MFFWVKPNSCNEQGILTLSTMTTQKGIAGGGKRSWTRSEADSGKGRANNPCPPCALHRRQGGGSTNLKHVVHVAVLPSGDRRSSDLQTELQDLRIGVILMGKRIATKPEKTHHHSTMRPKETHSTAQSALRGLPESRNREPLHIAAHLQGHLLERDDEVAQQPAPVPAAHLPPAPQRLSALRQPQACSLLSTSMLAGFSCTPLCTALPLRSACLTCYTSGKRAPLLPCLPASQHLR